MNNKELILRKDDGDKIFIFTFYPLENIYDAKTVCIFKETTHIHEIQKVADRVRSVIMGCLTHELRTPVNCVISIFKSLGNYIEDSDEARKLFSICEATIELLRSLTEDFIDFTRFENGRGLPINKEKVDIAELAKSIEDIFKYQAEEKELEFSIIRGPSVPQTVFTDKKRLKQVLLNLLSNAFKFTQVGKIGIKLNIVKEKNMKRCSTRNILNSTILCEAFKSYQRLTSNESLHESECYSEDNDEVGYSRVLVLSSPSSQKFLSIKVIDTGIGMNTEECKSIFVKFGMGKDAVKLNTNGLGLGLYLSKEIINKLGGDISFTSKKDRGSTFKILLPIEENLEQDAFLINQRSQIDQRLNDAEDLSCQMSI
jgi:two-component system, chemotaxis family, sensor kinase CheA